MRAFALLATLLCSTAAAFAVSCAQSDQSRIIELTQEAAHSDYHIENPQVTQMAIVEDYALTTYQGSNGSGQALLKKSMFTWTVIGVHDAMIPAGGMGEFGVPGDIAFKLVDSLQPVPSQ